MEDKSLALRITIYLILHGLLWAFAMILADSIWGDSVAQWMAVVFGVFNGIVAMLVITKMVSTKAAD